MALTRKTPLRAKPRSKGARGERAVVDILKTWGWKDARRNWMSGGMGGGDIIGGPADTHLEIKHHEVCKVWEWIRQAESEARATDNPVVVLRDNKHPWWCVMPADELAALRRLTPNRQAYTVVRRDSGRVQLWKWIDEASAGASGVATGVLPAVEFSRPGGGLYAAVPFGDFLAFLKIREKAL